MLKLCKLSRTPAVGPEVRHEARVLAVIASYPKIHLFRWISMDFKAFRGQNDAILLLPRPLAPPATGAVAISGSVSRAGPPVVGADPIHTRPVGAIEAMGS